MWYYAKYPRDFIPILSPPHTHSLTWIVPFRYIVLNSTLASSLSLCTLFLTFFFFLFLSLTHSLTLHCSFFLFVATIFFYLFSPSSSLWITSTHGSIPPMFGYNSTWLDHPKLSLSFKLSQEQTRSSVVLSSSSFCQLTFLLKALYKHSQRV